MNISEVSKASGLPPKTIRYYEEIGLVAPARGANGYRRFGESDVHKLAFLARARMLGFSIDNCRSLLALYEDETRESAQVRQIAAAHLAEVDEKITQLRELRATLARLVDACAGDSRPDCPILDDLGRHDETREAT